VQQPGTGRSCFGLEPAYGALNWPRTELEGGAIQLDLRSARRERLIDALDRRRYPRCIQRTSAPTSVKA
jgi:hypothetical protein